MKQRLSRGRRQLKERVASLVETSLERSRPRKSFAAGVVTLLASSGGTAKAASAAGAAWLWILGGTLAAVGIGAGVYVVAGDAEPDSNTEQHTAVVGVDESAEPATPPPTPLAVVDIATDAGVAASVPEPRAASRPAEPKRRPAPKRASTPKPPVDAGAAIEMATPDASLPASVTARILNLKQTSDNVIVTFNRGSEHGVAPGWSGVVTDGRKGPDVPGGEFKILKVMRRESVARIELSPEDLKTFRCARLWP